MNFEIISWLYCNTLTYNTNTLLHSRKKKITVVAEVFSVSNIGAVDENLNFDFDYLARYQLIHLRSCFSYLAMKEDFTIK